MILLPLATFASIFFCFRILVNGRGEKRRRQLEQMIDDEHESNFSRSKPIPNNMELNINADFLNTDMFTYYPTDIQDHTISTLESMRINIIEKSKRPMIKVEKDKTNKELKEEFGIANLDRIISGDDNLYKYLHSINSYADLLIQYNMKPAAKKILEHAVNDLKSDIKKTQELLKSI